MSDERVVAEPGLGNMMFGYVLLGLQPIPVVLLSREGVGSAEVVCARFGLSLVFILTICLVRRRGLATAQPGILALRGILGGVAVLLYFYSIQNAGAARGTLLNYTYPVWANLVAVLLGQRVGWTFWGGLLVALVGLWLVVVPERGWGERPIGSGEWAGLGSAIFSGCAVLTIKQLRRTDESLTIIASFSACGLLLSLFFFQEGPLSPLLEPQTIALGVSVGVLAFLGHVFFTRGYRGMNVQHATLLSLSVPMVAAVFGIALLNEPYSARLGVGACLILTSTTLVLLAKKADHPHPRA